MVSNERSIGRNGDSANGTVQQEAEQNLFCAAYGLPREQTSEREATPQEPRVNQMNQPGGADGNQRNPVAPAAGDRVAGGVNPGRGAANNFSRPRQEIERLIAQSSEPDITPQERVRLLTEARNAAVSGQSNSDVNGIVSAVHQRLGSAYMNLPIMEGSPQAAEIYGAAIMSLNAALHSRVDDPQSETDVIPRIKIYQNLAAAHNLMGGEENLRQAANVLEEAFSRLAASPLGRADQEAIRFSMLNSAAQIYEQLSDQVRQRNPQEANRFRDLANRYRAEQLGQNNQ